MQQENEDQKKRFIFSSFFSMIVALLKGDPINRSDETIIDL